MEKVKYISIFSAVLIAGLSAFIIFSQSEAAKVKKKFKFLEEKMKKTPEETQFISAAKANRIKELFAETCAIYAPAYSFSRQISSRDVSALVLNLRSQYSKISLKFYDFVFDFSEKGLADVNLTATMTSQLKSGDYFDEIRELNCTLKKIEDLWLLKKIEVVEVLEK